MTDPSKPESCEISEYMCFCRKNVFNCQITGEEPLILRSGPSVKKVITMGAQTTAGKVSEDRLHHETLGGMLLRR